MIDIKRIRETPDLVKKTAEEKNLRVDIDQLLAFDGRRREIETEFNDLRHEQRQAGEQMAKASKGEKAALAKSLKDVKTRLQTLDSERDTVEAQLGELMLLVPQIPHPDAPRGRDESGNVEVRRHGEPKRKTDFGFEFKDHLDLGTAFGLFDIERGVKIAGSRNYVLTGLGARLHEAVLRLAWDLMIERGYTPLTVPVLVSDKLMYGTGFFPLHQEEVYRCERDDQSLVGTAEVPVTGFHSDEILDEAELPKRYFARSTCFRREAGAGGKDTRGLYRIHFFDKLEQVIVCKADADESARLHAEIIANSEALLQALEMPYRVVEVCTGDMGQGKFRMYDIETWMPSRDAFSETHSASSFHDFQARRLNLRYRDSATGKPEFCHTLNNTVVASPRILIPLIELHQNADGSITVPQALRVHLGGIERIGK
ncbi:MAG: serine--tRNA ligase [Phycisphaerae bacterium]|nr:serine--tRNA ligase [Phycisphaerae bacterium]